MLALAHSASGWLLSSGKAARDETELLEEHIPGLRRFARALLHGNREAADDLVQDSLERALSRWQQRRRDGDLRSWIYTILYHRFVTDRKRQRRRGDHRSLSEVQEAEQPGVEGGQDGALARRDLIRGLATLSEEQRSVLLLVGVEDFSYEEAARILGLPIGTVMSRLSRGRERLRRYMNGDGVRIGQRKLAVLTITRGVGTRGCCKSVAFSCAESCESANPDVGKDDGSRDADGLDGKVVGNSVGDEHGRDVCRHHAEGKRNPGQRSKEAEAAQCAR
jgi:RNA polymerase sigma-70 factor, ECF subfamily